MLAELLSGLVEAESFARPVIQLTRSRNGLHRRIADEYARRQQHLRAPHPLSSSAPLLVEVNNPCITTKTANAELNGFSYLSHQLVAAVT